MVGSASSSLGGVERERILAWCFVGSGFSALSYQVILSRSMQLVVGGTAYAISALLVAFMLGLAIGSAIGGRLADRSSTPLRVYAVAEAAIGVYCISFPLLFRWLEAFYLHVTPSIEGGSLGGRHLVRFCVGVLAFLLPSIFMGITTPAFARALAGAHDSSGLWLARLYGWNTFGASCGAFASAYVLVPSLGLVGSMTLVSLINFSIAALTYFGNFGLAGSATTARPTRTTTTRGEPAMPWFLFVAFGSGVLSFGLEIIWTHLLAMILGNSVYAFGLMLGSLLLGLGIGSVIARYLAEPESRALHTLGLLFVFAGASVLITIGAWDDVPRVFLWMAHVSPTFLLMESVRFAVALALMLIPSCLFGASFPLLLRCAAMSPVSRSAIRNGTRNGIHSDFGSRIGWIYGINTIGAVCGSLAGSYLLLPFLGSLESLRSLGIGLLVVGAIAIYAFRGEDPKRKRLSQLVLASSVLVYFVPLEWNFNTLNMAAAIYLGDSASQHGKMLYQKEDPTGGLTTVIEDKDVRTLLTNGKFQGDSSEEVPIQHRLANIPMLFTSGRERALVIGLGSGVTLASLASHGFRQVICAEFSSPIVEAAGKYFANVNGGILKSPNVVLYEEDGRSVLVESPKRYDVISVEVTTIWFAGVGPIYSREFYQIAQKRLRRNGVLLQWFPIHHLKPRNLFVVVNSVRSVFPFVSVWTHRHQGFVIASNEPLEIDIESVRSDLLRKETQPYFRELDSGSPLEILSDLVVTDRDVDEFLDAMARLLHTDRNLVSTDTWPTLEYETPKDLLDNFSYFQNRATFRRFRSRELFPFRGTPTETERLLAETSFVKGWGDPRVMTRLALAADHGNDLSEVASRWVLDELGGEDVVGTRYRTDPVRDFARAAGSVERLLKSADVNSTCGSEPPLYEELGDVPLRVEEFAGESVSLTSPNAVVDGVANPELARGWVVRPAGRYPSIDLALDRPRKIERVWVVARSAEGTALRTRILGRNEQGRWLPLAGGGGVEDSASCDVRIYTFADSTPSLTTLRVELRGTARSRAIELFEVAATEKHHANGFRPPGPGQAP